MLNKEDKEPPLLERVINVMQTVSENAQKNVTTLQSLHNLATVRSLQHVIGAVIVMIILVALLYSAMLRAEQRSIEQWSELLTTLKNMPTETAKQLHLHQNNTNHINVEKAEGIFEEISRKVLEGKVLEEKLKKENE